MGYQESIVEKHTVAMKEGKYFPKEVDLKYFLYCRFNVLFYQQHFNNLLFLPKQENHEVAKNLCW